MDEIGTFALGIVRKYRENARRYAVDRAKQLEACGDLEGYRIWLEVGDRAQALLLNAHAPATRGADPLRQDPDYAGRVRRQVLPFRVRSA